MPGYKRGSYKKSYKRALTKKYGSPKKVIPAVRTLQAVVRRAIANNNNKMIETKRGCQTSTDGVEIFHNNFVTLNSTMLFTSNGPNDPTLNSSDNRIGDQINLKGVSIKMMVELNERYTNCTFRLFVVKCAKGDTPTRATLFNGLSGNKMLDSVNTERYTILYQKYFTIKAGNLAGPYTDSGGVVVPSGTGVRTGDYNSRMTRIIKAWIPGKKFVRSGIIKYEGQGSTSQPKFFDYHCLLYAYSNYSTSQDVYYVGRVNDYVQQIYFKDA